MSHVGLVTLQSVILCVVTSCCLLLSVHYLLKVVSLIRSEWYKLRLDHQSALCNMIINNTLFKEIFYIHGWYMVCVDRLRLLTCAASPPSWLTALSHLFQIAGHTKLWHHSPNPPWSQENKVNEQSRKRKIYGQISGNVASKQCLSYASQMYILNYLLF